jgi:hypothetical protein
MEERAYWYDYGARFYDPNQEKEGFKVFVALKLNVINKC